MAFASIRASVGKYNNGRTPCYNTPNDVATVVRLLNFIASIEGGRSGNPLPQHPSADLLHSAILNFQSVQNNRGRTPRLSVDGHVDPGGMTIVRLNLLAHGASPVDPPDMPPDPPLPLPVVPTRSSQWHITKDTDFTATFGPENVFRAGVLIAEVQFGDGPKFAMASSAIGVGAGTKGTALVKEADTVSKNMLKGLFKLFPSIGKIGPIFDTRINNPNELIVNDLTGTFLFIKVGLGFGVGAKAGLFFFGCSPFLPLVMTTTAMGMVPVAGVAFAAATANAIGVPVTGIGGGMLELEAAWLVGDFVSATKVE